MKKVKWMEQIIYNAKYKVSKKIHSIWWNKIQFSNLIKNWQIKFKILCLT